MERPTCKTCPYWKQLSEAELYGECRHGPAKHGAETQLNCDPGTVSITWGTWFDQHEDEWCGAHPNFPAYIASLKPPDPASNFPAFLQKFVKGYPEIDLTT